MKFKDQVVLVTGANRNTGLAIAEAFAREGAVVWLNARLHGKRTASARPSAPP